MKQYQQGDVLLEQVARIPVGAKKRQDRGILVLMAGEATGHHHTCISDKAVMYDLTLDGVTDLYLEVSEPITITHEEHKGLPLPGGIYKIGQVREFDYFQELERRVMD